MADFLDEENEVLLKSITSLIEPVILIFMGGMVLMILLAIYLPILQLVGNLGSGGQ